MTPTDPAFEREISRIREEYARRARHIDPDFYALDRPANLFIRQNQARAVLSALADAGLLPLRERRILDIGCGAGDWIGEFERLGARLERMAGVDLDQSRIEAARARFSGADFRLGDATSLPMDDASFDIVSQFTVFTSILDEALRHALAREMLRVLKPDGVVLWCDFRFNNPSNKNVRGIGKREIARLFPGCRMRLRRVTFLPPLLRRLVPYSWEVASALESLRWLNIHYVGIVQRAPSTHSTFSTFTRFAKKS